MLTPDEIKIFSLCVPHLPNTPIIFDIGAYKGTYTEHVLSVLSQANCYLFEPNTLLFLELAKKYRAYNLAVSNANGDKTFYSCMDKADELSSTYKREIFSEVEYKEEIISSITIDTFCTTLCIQYIDFLKIDVEGAELDVLVGSESLLKAKRIQFIQVEYGGTYVDSGITFERVMRFMGEYGYKVYELVNNKLTAIIPEAFVEDYRFTNFLITCHDFR